MTSKKIKPIQMLATSFKQEHHERNDLHQNRVESIDQKLPGHHRAQQSMDISSQPFKIDKGTSKNQRGAKVGYLEKKTNVVSSVHHHQPEEQKSCLTERAGKPAAGSSTTSAATQNKEAQPGSSSGHPTRNERASRLINRNHHQYHQAQPNNSNVSNQTTGGGSTGSRRSQSSQNDLRSGGQKARRKHHPPITDLGSSQHQTPKGAYFSMSRQLAPSNSSIPPSSCADDKSSDSDAHEYHSMWADISGCMDQTNESNSKYLRDGDSYAVDVEHDTEYQSYQYLFNKSLCPSNLGQVDQNSSFQGSQSQASQYGQDLDSSFHESATNSTWAKSDRNSQYLKSQHSCSTYNKQKTNTGGDKKATTAAQQSAQVAQQHTPKAAAGSQPSYVQGYAPRRPSAFEESKTVIHAQGTKSPYLHGSVSAANLATCSNVHHHEEQMSVSSSASSAQKYISQQKAHHHRGMTSTQQASSQQDLSLSGHMQSSSGRGPSLQTPSKEHQTIESLAASGTSPAAPQTWHSQFTNKEKIMAFSAAGQGSGGGFSPAMHSRGGGATAINNESGSASMMLQGGPDAAIRAQMSQSVEPIINRNIQQSQVQMMAASQHLQAVPMTHHPVTQSSMSARQQQYIQPQSSSSSAFEAFPSPSNASSNSNPCVGGSSTNNHSTISVSGFSAAVNVAGGASMGQTPFPNGSSTSPAFLHHQYMSSNQMMYPEQTMFTPYDPNNQRSQYHPQPAQVPAMMAAKMMIPQFINMSGSAASSQQSPQQPPQNFNKMSQSAQQANMVAQRANLQNLSGANTSTQPLATQHFYPAPVHAHQQEPMPQDSAALFELDKHLSEIERFYEAEKVPCPRAEFNSYLEQMRGISNLYQRHIAQQNLFFHLHQLLRSSSQITQSNQHALSQRSGYDHRRDYSSSSSASKISSSSHHSSVSSQHRSSHQNNLKLALAQAFRDFESIQTAEESTQFLIAKAPLLAKDKSGFQLLKTKIDEEVFQLAQQDLKKQSQAQNGGGSKFVDDLFKQLLSPEYSSFHKLMMHQVANFFCQELFRQATRKQLEQVLEFIKNDFYKIAIDIHGTRALQVLLEDELINKDKRTDKVSSLICEALKNGRILELSCNIRGNHVLRQCLILIKTDERRSIIYEPVVQHFSHIARDKHGCQVVKDCITTAQGQWKKDLIRVSFESIEILINDEFGNFVIQAILEHFISLSKRKSKIMDVRVSCVYEFIRQNLAKLCKQQYSSRVVEKAVETMPKDQFERLCVIYMKNSTKKSKLFKDIMLDSYGNYIAPKILERAKYFGLQQQLDYFTKVYRDSIEALKKVKHGRQLMGKINQILPGLNKTKQPTTGSTSAQAAASTSGAAAQQNQACQQNQPSTSNQ